MVKRSKYHCAYCCVYFIHSKFEINYFLLRPSSDMQSSLPLLITLLLYAYFLKCTLLRFYIVFGFSLFFVHFFFPVPFNFSVFVIHSFKKLKFSYRVGNHYKLLPMGFGVEFWPPNHFCALKHRVKGVGVFWRMRNF